MAASAIAMHKINFKRIITNATENTSDPIHFPETLHLTKDGKLRNTEYSGPYVIKPVKGGSSVGVTIIKDPQNHPTLALGNNESLWQKFL